MPLPSEREARLLFAGEATHDYYYSTLHGAYSSGLQEAERALQRLRPDLPVKHKL